MPTQQQEIEFSDLLNRHYPVINSICLRCCEGSAFYFEELRQECVLALWEEFSRYNLSRFRGDSSESTWINSIAYHAAVHYLRNPEHQELLPLADQYGLETLSSSEVSDDWHLLDDITEQLNHRERILLEHYLNAYHFPGGHTPTAEQVKTWHVPLIEKLLKGLPEYNLSYSLI